jgi:hypothetical protein
MTSSVYPETMGVPLEEMDAVFGEGSLFRVVVRPDTDIFCAEELEERLDNESERASLVSNTLPINHQAIRPRLRSSSPSARGWVSRLMRRNDGRAHYEPIADAEE